MTEADIAAAIEDTIAWFKQRNAPFFFWWVDLQATPVTLDAALQAHGLTAWEVNAPGSAAGAFIWPDTIAVDTTGSLYVGEVATGMRMQKFQR